MPLIDGASTCLLAVNCLRWWVWFWQLWLLRRVLLKDPFVDNSGVFTALLPPKYIHSPDRNPSHRFHPTWTHKIWRNTLRHTSTFQGKPFKCHVFSWTFDLQNYAFPINIIINHISTLKHQDTSVRLNFHQCRFRGVELSPT